MSETKQQHETSEAFVPSLLSIAKSMRALHGLKLGIIGFYNGQDELLLVTGREGKTVSQVADELCVRPSTVSKMVDRLVEKGLMERSGDQRDARRTLVRITPAGIQACSAIRKAHQELEDDLAKGLSGKELHSFQSCLGEVSAMLSTRLKRYR